MQVGSRSYFFNVVDGDDHYHSGTATYIWPGPGFSWAAANVGDKVSVSLRQVPAVDFTFSTEDVTVDEGSTTEYTVQLAAQPAESVTATIATYDTHGATVAPAALTFTRSTWNRAQRDIVTGGQDDDPGDEEVRLIHSGGGVNEGIVAVTVNDDDVGTVPNASANVLVSNLHVSRYRRTTLFRPGDFFAQAFTTGPNPTGYALESADVAIVRKPALSSALTVSIRKDSSGNLRHRGHTIDGRAGRARLVHRKQHQPG